nr:reverse transcriptase domain-containing protein [Tanacetum cinerariifolium]
VPLILGRPFLLTARALIDVHGEEMILRDGDERLTLNMRHDTSSYSNQPQKESINLINVFNNSSEDILKDLFSNQPSGNPTFLSHPELTSSKFKNDIFDSEGSNILPEKLLDLGFTKDLHPPLHDNQLSGSTTYSFSSNLLLEEFADELALITFPLKYDDDLQFDVESDLKEIKSLLYQDIDSSLKDSINQSNLTNPADNFVDSIPEMFADEHALDYSSPPIFDEYDDDFLEAWDRYKDLLRACPNHGFTELYKLDTFYNALNPADQDSLNAAAGGNLLERQIAKLTHAVNQQMSAVTTAMTAMLKQFQATPSSASVKAVEETYVTCGGAPAVNYNQDNSGYRSPGMANQIRPPGFAQPNVQNNQNRFGQPQGFNRGNEFNPEESYQASAQQNQNVHLNELEKSSLSNQTNEIKNMIAGLFQMNSASTSGSGSLPSNTVANSKGELKSITTRSGRVLDGPTVPTPTLLFNLEEDKRVEETLIDPNLAEYTIKKKLGLPELIFTRMTLELATRSICTPAGIARDVFILVGKFTFPADFVIVDYESDPRVPLILGRPFLWTARALIDVHGEEMILHDGDKRLTLNMRHDTSSYSNQPQKESINLINVFNNSSEDILEDLFSNQPSGNPTFSSHPELTSPKVKNDIFDSEGSNILPERLLDLGFTKDLHPPLHDNQLSGSTTYSFSFNLLLEEFADELALITFPPKYDDDLQFDVESDLKEIESLLYQDIDSSLKDSINQNKKLAISNASSVLEDFDPPFYEPLFFNEVPSSKMLLPMSSENEEKVFKPRIHTSKKVHSSFIPELSHQGYKVFKINQIFKSR